jgi:hypothetical protein
MEGIGHDYTKRRLEQGRALRHILRDERAAELPDRALIPLHAGMGLVFAERILNPLSGQNEHTAWKYAMNRFFDLCRLNSRDGYAGVTMEALGLVARTLYPQHIPVIDRRLAESDLYAAALFWHGVGRALYFLPGQFLSYSGSPGQIVNQIREEAPHRLGLYNMMAGFAWPLVLVNIRHPRIVETYLREGFNRIPEQSGFTQGVCAALLTWRDATPEQTGLQTFLEHRPAPEDALTVSFWDRHIRERGEKAMREAYPVLKKTRRMETLFRYASEALW